MGDNFQDILYDIRDRLIRLETKMEGMQEAKQKAYEAYNLALKNQESLQELKDTHKWLWRTIVGLFIALIFQLLWMEWGK